MPRLSLRTVLLRAIPAAVEDRRSLADCWPADSEGRAQALIEAEQAGALPAALAGHKGPLDQLPEETHRLCFAVLVWAAQWETSVADANHNRGQHAKEAAAAARLYETTRHAHFGLSQDEHMLRTAPGVPFSEIVLGKKSGWS